MDYLNLYNSLVERARQRPAPQHYEQHHVVPKSLGGVNNTTNLVKFTVREHFVAHRLLTKIYQGEAQKKMWFAYYRLCNRHRLTNSRSYEQSKMQAKRYLSQIHSGKTISEAHKQAIREKCRGMVGKKHSTEARTSMTQAKLGNSHARVGIDIVDSQTMSSIESLYSIADLCKRFDLTRGQAEHYIYKQVPYNGLLFVRQKIIKRK